MIKNQHVMFCGFCKGFKVLYLRHLEEVKGYESKKCFYCGSSITKKNGRKTEYNDINVMVVVNSLREVIIQTLQR